MSLRSEVRPGSSLFYLGSDGNFEHIDDQLEREEAERTPAPMSSVSPEAREATLGLFSGTVCFG